MTYLSKLEGALNETNVEYAKYLLEKENKIDILFILNVIQKYSYTIIKLILENTENIWKHPNIKMLSFLIKNGRDEILLDEPLITNEYIEENKEVEYYGSFIFHLVAEYLESKAALRIYNVLNGAGIEKKVDDKSVLYYAHIGNKFVDNDKFVKKILVHFDDEEVKEYFPQFFKKKKYKRSIKLSEREISQKIKEIRRLRLTLSNQQRNIEEFTKYYDKSKSIINEMEEKNVKLVDMLETCKDKNEKLGKKMKDLINEKDNFSRKIKELKKNEQINKIERDDLMVEIKKTNKEKDVLTKKLNESKEKNEALLKGNKDLEKIIEKAEKKFDERIDFEGIHIKDIENKINLEKLIEKDEQLKNQKEEIEALKEEIEALKEEIKKLKGSKTL